MKIIGHRGARGLAPENTIASLQAALDHKVDAIEFDVRTTRDGVPVLHHNSDIGRAGFDLDIAKTDFKDLKAAKFDLATLDEALRFLKGRVPVVIEIKHGSNIQHIASVIRDRLHNGWRAEDIAISSFHMPLLYGIKAELPDVQLIINEQWSVLRARRRAEQLDTTYITMNQRWLRTGLVRWLSKSYKLSAYTINDPVQARKWAKRGLYAAITDFPDEF